MLHRALKTKNDKTDSATEQYRRYEPDLRESQLVVIGGKGVGVAFGWALPSFLVWLIKGRDYWLGMTPSMWNGKQWAKTS